MRVKLLSLRTYPWCVTQVPQELLGSSEDLRTSKVL